MKRFARSKYPISITLSTLLAAPVLWVAAPAGQAAAAQQIHSPATFEEFLKEARENLEKIGQGKETTDDYEAARRDGKPYLSPAFKDVKDLDKIVKSFKADTSAKEVDLKDKNKGLYYAERMRKFNDVATAYVDQGLLGALRTAVVNKVAEAGHFEDLVKACLAHDPKKIGEAIANLTADGINRLAKLKSMPLHAGILASVVALVISIISRAAFGSGKISIDDHIRSERDKAWKNFGPEAMKRAVNDPKTQGIWAAVQMHFAASAAQGEALIDAQLDSARRRLSKQEVAKVEHEALMAKKKLRDGLRKTLSRDSNDLLDVVGSAVAEGLHKPDNFTHFSVEFMDQNKEAILSALREASCKNANDGSSLGRMTYDNCISRTSLSQFSKDFDKLKSSMTHDASPHSFTATELKDSLKKSRDDTPPFPLFAVPEVPGFTKVLECKDC